VAECFGVDTVITKQTTGEIAYFLIGDRATSVGAGLLLIIWLSTALLQAPYHQRLSQGFDLNVHQQLVRTNWIRMVVACVSSKP
jgi:hypothetical protein